MEEQREAFVVEKVGIIRGRFRILHAGHFELFRQAKFLVDHLVVLIDSDSRLKELGDQIIFDELDRMQIIGSCKYVDEVIAFENEEQFNNNIDYYRGFKKVVYFKGGDYRPKDLAEYQELADKNVIVCCLGHTGHSTTDIVKRIKESL